MTPSRQQNRINRDFIISTNNNSSSKTHNVIKRSIPHLRSQMFVGTQDKYIHYRHNLYSSFLYRGRLTRAEKTRRKDRLSAQDSVTMIQMEKHLAKTRTNDKQLFGKLLITKKPSEIVKIKCRSNVTSVMRSNQNQSKRQEDITPLKTKDIVPPK